MLEFIMDLECWIIPVYMYKFCPEFSVWEFYERKTYFAMLKNFFSMRK